MSRIVAAEDLSLDGVAEDPGPTGAFEHRGWTIPAGTTSSPSTNPTSSWQAMRCCLGG
jgi:hypothetical protein